MISTLKLLFMVAPQLLGSLFESNKQLIIDHNRKLSASHAASSPKPTSTSHKSGIGTKLIVSHQIPTHELDSPRSSPDSEPSTDSSPDDPLLAMVHNMLTCSTRSSDITQLLSTNKNASKSSTHQVAKVHKQHVCARTSKTTQVVDRGANGGLVGS